MRRLYLIILTISAFIAFLLFLESVPKIFAAGQDGFSASVDFLDKKYTIQELRTVSIGEYIAKLYRASLYVGAALAVGSIIFGALQKILNASNPSKQSDGNDRITSAMWGLVLLAGSVLILQTVNPEIVKLKSPEGIPLCSGAATDKPGVNCLKTPISKICGNPPAEGEVTYTNCLPACPSNATPCGPYEKAGNNGCVPCIQKIEICSDKFFQKTIADASGNQVPNPDYCTSHLTKCGSTETWYMFKPVGHLDVGNIQFNEADYQKILANPTDADMIKRINQKIREVGIYMAINDFRTGIAEVKKVTKCVGNIAEAKISRDDKDKLGGLDVFESIWMHPYYKKSDGPTSATCRVFATRRNTSFGAEDKEKKFEYFMDNLKEEKLAPC